MDVHSIIENHSNYEMNINQYVLLTCCESGNVELLDWILNDMSIHICLSTRTLI